MTLDWPSAATAIFVAILVAYCLLVVVRTLERVALHKATVFAEVEVQKALRMAKMRTSIGKRKSSKTDSDDDDNDIPPWINGIARGAGISIEKLIDEDPVELGKVRTFIDAKLAKKSVGHDDYIE